MKTFTAFVALMVIFTIITVNAWGEIRYTVTDLGTTPGGAGGFANGINASGQVVGYASHTLSNHAFRFTNGTMTDLGVPSSGYSSYATGINDNGQVVGYANNGQAFLYGNGTMTYLNIPGGVLEANGINASGQFVGQNGNGHAFLYSNGTTTDLQSFGGLAGCAYGINDNGQVVGYDVVNYRNTERAFLYSKGSKVYLDPLPGCTNGEGCATAINNSGQVVGYDTDFESEGGIAPRHFAYFYNNGTKTYLGTLSGGNYGGGSIATGLNSSGQVVGYFGDNVSYPYSSPLKKSPNKNCINL